jgi:V8-like Glu-specific endopeptidase
MLRESELELFGGLGSGWQREYEGEFEGEFEDELEAELEAEFETEREIIGLADTRVRVTNTSAAPFRYICNFEYNGSPMCSGTLIAPNVVLTAAHCLHDKKTNRRRDPRRMTVIPGRDAGRRPFGTAHALRFNFARGYRDRRDNVTPRDYAVIYLREPIGNRVGFWTIAHTSSPRDPLGTSISAAPLPSPLGRQRVNLSGYPGDRCFVTAASAGRRLCHQWRAKDRAVVEQAGMLHYLNDTFGGHSGSPVWVKRDASLGGRVMVGIHVGADDRGRPGATPVVANRGVRITPAILADIRRLLRQAPPVPRPPRQLPIGPFRILDRFQHAQPGVQPHHRAVIEEIARRIVSSISSPPVIHTVRLVGHADSSGPDAFNLNLGRQRALDVQRQLVAAIDRLRPGHSRRVSMVVQSLGEAKPIANNNTPEGRARNRRVEVFLAGR